MGDIWTYLLFGFLLCIVIQKCDWDSEELVQSNICDVKNRSRIMDMKYFGGELFYLSRRRQKHRKNSSKIVVEETRYFHKQPYFQAIVSGPKSLDIRFIQSSSSPRTRNIDNDTWTNLTRFFTLNLSYNGNSIQRCLEIHPQKLQKSDNYSSKEKPDFDTRQSDNKSQNVYQKMIYRILKRQMRKLKNKERKLDTIRIVKGSVIPSFYVMVTVLSSINCLLIIIILCIKRKYRCVCLKINIQTRKIPQNNRKSQFLEQNSDEGSGSEYENEAINKSIVGRIRGRFLQMKKRFTKMMKSSHQGGTVKVTDYHGMAPRYLYTSLSQDEPAVGIEEPEEDVYEEIPAGGWDLEDAADDISDYPETGVVPMKEYEEVPIAYHGPQVCDDKKM